MEKGKALMAFPSFCFKSHGGDEKDVCFMRVGIKIVQKDRSIDCLSEVFTSWTNSMDSAVGS
jgi:hypothetical protein